MSKNPLRAGLVPLHILYHAVQEEIYGLEMLEELRRHGYSIGPGTLYPMLHRLKSKGYLKVRVERQGRSSRRYYRATAKGVTALDDVKPQVVELFNELIRERKPHSIRK